MRRAAKIDTNQPAIVHGLRKAGLSVAITSSLGDGFPDLVVGRAGVTYLLEVKHGKGDLTDDEREFSERWQGHYAIVRSVAEAYEVCGVPEWTPPF